MGFLEAIITMFSDALESIGLKNVSKKSIWAIIIIFSIIFILIILFLVYR